MIRLMRFPSAVLAVFSLLVIRLADLQLLHGAEYRELAEQNRLRLVPEPAPRGVIVDRRGRVLAANQTVFHAALVPQEVQERSVVLRRVGEIIHRSPELLEREFRKARGLAFLPAIIAPRIPKELAIRLEEERWQLPGVLVKAEPVRSYPLGSVGAHILGYLSQPTPEELPLLKSYGIRPKELVGRTGVEQLLDQSLRGRPGGLLVEVNSRGKQVRVVSYRPPVPGAHVVLTVDAKLLALIEQRFGAQPGAAVVLNPQTGEVLAAVSAPAPADVVKVLNDPASPLMNRAGMGLYQPGSIMKLITAGAALERHVISPSETIVCPGSLTIGDRIFHCWYRDGHGPMMLRDALVQSCNVYFMTVGRRVGAGPLRDAMREMGLSRRSGWPLEERSGHVPERRLTEGDVAQLAIGQSELLITPLQAAVMAGALANRGWLVEPWLVTSVGDHAMPHPPLRRRVNWSASTFEAVRQGMIAVVQDREGTGHRAFSHLVTIAAKTGTAQTQRPGKTHAWFVGFCPVEHPKVAMAIVAEYGGSGGDLPAEIGKLVCEYMASAS